jgi:hypothetical protein
MKRVLSIPQEVAGFALAQLAGTVVALAIAAVLPGRAENSSAH